MLGICYYGLVIMGCYYLYTRLITIIKNNRIRLRKYTPRNYHKRKHKRK